MPPRRRADPAELAAARKAYLTGDATTAQLRLLTRHFARLLAEKAPGHAVEVRVPPWSAVQAVAGPRHTRGTPPAVVEMSPETWVALALGSLTWHDAVADHRVTASGERADLTPYLPLTEEAP